MSPRGWGSNGEVTLGAVSRTAWIRLADTLARGYIMNTVQNSITDSIAWNRYSMKATSLPTCRMFASIMPAAT